MDPKEERASEEAATAKESVEDAEKDQKEEEDIGLPTQDEIILKI